MPGQQNVNELLEPAGARAKVAWPPVLSDYAPPADRYDECRLSNDAVRPSWQPFCELLQGLSRAEFADRWDQSQRLIREHRIAYSTVSDSSARRWQLDPLPLLVGEEDWATAAAGVAQRAELLQLVLADLLGPQRLIKEGVVPAELLFGHPGFRLPMHGASPVGGTFLQYYACDLARTACGGWQVLCDRTESPSGIGFALENRVVLSRMLPDVYRLSQVHRLAPFFMTLRAQLCGLAPAHRENPRVVIYTRGPDDPNYFEDAYLARYLGFTLVEGDDLTVRSSAVWLKTLDGLLPVDVVVRRPNSEACDPLEFTDRSNVGVAGLLHAERNGKVSVANVLGSGLVESPVFMAMLPRLSKFFLQQELKLPGIATWWCGEEDSLSYVLENLDKLTVVAAFRRRQASHEADRQLNGLPVDELREKIRADPAAYVAQQRPLLSTAPAWHGGKSLALCHVVRAFAVAQDDSYLVMQGGLVRTSPVAAADSTTPLGRGCKDLWVLSSTPVGQVSLLPPRDDPLVIRRAGADLPSRVAENLYWFGRQIERSDALARQLRTLVLRLTSETADGGGDGAAPLLRALAAAGQLEPDYAVQELRRAIPSLESALPGEIFNPQRSGSLRSAVDQMVQSASLVRDRLSTDAWRVLIGIERQMHPAHPRDAIGLTETLNRLNALIVDLAAIEGLSMESMIRSHVFRFFDIGRRLERAVQITRLLQNCFLAETNISVEMLEAVLEVADSQMTYRSRYLANLQMTAVLDLLLTDETNPRSVAFQLHSLQQSFRSLPNQGETAPLPTHQRLVLSLVHLIQMADVARLCEQYRCGDRGPLAATLSTLEQDLPNLSHALVHRFLVHAGPAQRLDAVRQLPLPIDLAEG